MPLDMNTDQVSDAEFEEATATSDALTEKLQALIESETANLPTPDKEAIHGLAIGGLAQKYTATYPESTKEFGKMLVGHTIIGVMDAVAASSK